MSNNMLKSIMIKNNDTVDSLAEKLGISNTSLYSKLNGKYDFTAKEMKEISDLYGIERGKEFDAIFFN